MRASALTRNIGIIIAAIALCAAVAGCVSDSQAAPSKKSKTSSQLRYHGGPKSPMWQGQQSTSKQIGRVAYGLASQPQREPYWIN